MTIGATKYLLHTNRPEKGRSGGSGGGGGTTTEARATAPLPEGVRARRLGGTNAIYDFDQDGNRVSMQISNVLGEHIVDFSVNGRFNTSGSSGLDASQGAAIARKVSAIMKHDASRRPDGFFYSTSAVTGDGLGASRTALYARAGFSLPSRAGSTQYAVVRNRRLTPSDRNKRPLSQSELATQNKAVREALRTAAISRRVARN